MLVDPRCMGTRHCALPPEVQPSTLLSLVCPISDLAETPASDVLYYSWRQIGSKTVMPTENILGCLSQYNGRRSCGNLEPTHKAGGPSTPARERTQSSEAVPHQRGSNRPLPGGSGLQIGSPVCSGRCIERGVECLIASTTEREVLLCSFFSRS